MAKRAATNGAAKTPQKISLVDAIAQATAEDLADLDQQIASLETKLDGLRAARKIIGVRINGAVTTRMRALRAEGDDESRASSSLQNHRERVAAVRKLLTEKGPLGWTQILQHVTFSSGSLNLTLKDPTFAKVNGQYELAKSTANVS